MTATHFARCLSLAFAAYDRQEFGIETLSSLVRALEAQAESMGLLEEARRIRRENYEAPANG
jgi:hypothetical protein